MENIYTTIGIILPFGLLVAYFILRYKDQQNPILESLQFGSEHRKINFSEQILHDKIKHKNIAFYAYLASIAISFLLGGWAVYKIVSNELQWKLLKDALGIAAGTVSTASFKKLYDKCSEEVKDLNTAKQNLKTD